jgi:hypothetical protein
MREYLLLELQPAKIIPYTESEEIAKRNRIPVSGFATWRFNSLKPTSSAMELWSGIVPPKGIIDQDIMAQLTEIAGAMRYMALFTCVGKTSSFVRNFIPSARGWNNPNGPALFGPLLS